MRQRLLQRLFSDKARPKVEIVYEARPKRQPIEIKVEPVARLGADDVLVARLPENAPHSFEILSAIVDRLREAFPEREVLLLAGGVTLETVPLDELRRLLGDSSGSTSARGHRGRTESYGV